MSQPNAQQLHRMAELRAFLRTLARRTATGVIRTAVDPSRGAEIYQRYQNLQSLRDPELNPLLYGDYEEVKEAQQEPKVNKAGYPIHYYTTVGGMRIAVENRSGSYRRGTDPDGNEWKTKMKNPYGEILDTMAPDGDAVDVFIGPDKKSEFVLVVHTSKRGTDEYDEDKVILGCKNRKEALKIFQDHYTDWEMHYLCDTPMTLQELKEKLRRTRKKPRRLDKEASFEDFGGNQLQDIWHQNPTTLRERVIRHGWRALPAAALVTLLGTAGYGGYRVLKSPEEEEPEKQASPFGEFPASREEVEDFLRELGMDQDQITRAFGGEPPAIKLKTNEPNSEPTPPHADPIAKNADPTRSALQGMIEELATSQGMHPDSSSFRQLVGNIVGETDLHRLSTGELQDVYDVLSTKQAQIKVSQAHNTLAIDFDHTLWSGGKPVQGAKDALERFQAAGWKLIIFSVRGDKDFIAKRLDQHGIPYDHINHNPDQPEGASGKVIATHYIDDRAVPFKGNWKETADQVLQGIPHWTEKKTEEGQEKRAWNMDRALIRMYVRRGEIPDEGISDEDIRKYHPDGERGAEEMIARRNTGTEKTSAAEDGPIDDDGCFEL